jgi:hypothetical protein
MTQIQLFGKELQMSYNLQTAIAFERMTGKNPLQLDQFGGDVEGIVTIAYCMLLSNNDAYHVPDFEVFLREIHDIHTMNTVITATSQEMQRFFAPQPGDKQPSADTTEDAPKND